MSKFWIKSKESIADKEKWYYDACTLDTHQAYTEILNHDRSKIRSIIGHLSWGEALGNCYIKGKDKYEALNELIGRFISLVVIVGHDDTEDILRRIREEFPRLSITDALHFATAIKQGCQNLRTMDRDLYGLDKEQIKKIASEFGLENFYITRLRVN